MTTTPTIQPHPLAQHEREMLVGAFLDITGGEWAAWIQRTGDDQIPSELHEHLVSICEGIGDHENYQLYLQALCMLADGHLLWLVRQVGNSPL